MKISKTPIKNEIGKIAKAKYLELVFCLWEEGAAGAHQEYPDISVEQFQKANDYYDTLRCEGCYCGSCVGLGELSKNLDNSPIELKPLADLALKLGEEEFHHKTSTT